LRAHFLGDHERAVKVGDESVSAARDAGDMPLLSLALASLGRALLAPDGPEDPRAAGALEESLAVARAAGSRHASGQALATLGDLAWRRSDTARAIGLWQQALELRRELQTRRGIAISLEQLAHGAAGIEDLAGGAAVRRGRDTAYRDRPSAAR
jgi:hypothetical protein